MTARGSVDERWTVAGSGTAGDPIDVLVASPHSVESPRVAIMLFPDGFGIHEHVRQIARRLAARGAAVAVPDVFHRLGKQVSFGLDALDDAMSAIEQVTEQDIAASTDAGRSVLEGLGGARPIVGVGFCFGGRVALVARGMRPDAFAGTVAFYPNGMLSEIAEWSRRPIDWSIRGTAPVMVVFGEADRLIPSMHADGVVEELNRSGVEPQALRYPGAGHAFVWEAHPNYDAEAAADAWRRLIGFVDGLAEREVLGSNG